MPKFISFTSLYMYILVDSDFVEFSMLMVVFREKRRSFSEILEVRTVCIHIIL